MSPSLTATVCEMETEAEYGGSVYERTVTLEVDGQNLVVFEGGNVLNENDVGSKLELVVHVGIDGDLILAREDESQLCDIGLRQNKKRDSKWAGSVCADVVDESLKDRWFGDAYARVLEADVGVGTVVATANSDVSEEITAKSAGSGDRIQAHAWRLGIVGRIDND